MKALATKINLRESSAPVFHHSAVGRVWKAYRALSRTKALPISQTRFVRARWGGGQFLLIPSVSPAIEATETGRIERQRDSEVALMVWVPEAGRQWNCFRVLALNPSSKPESDCSLIRPIQTVPYVVRWFQGRLSELKSSRVLFADDQGFAQGQSSLEHSPGWKGLDIPLNERGKCREMYQWMAFGLGLQIRGYGCASVFEIHFVNRKLQNFMSLVGLNDTYGHLWVY